MRTIDADEFLQFIKNVYCPECDNYNTSRCELCSVSSLLDGLDNTPTVDQWHYPSRGEYPQKGRQVLVYAWNVHFMLAKYDNMRTIDEGDKDMFVTYDANCVMREIKKVIAWMPLPEPPKEEA